MAEGLDETKPDGSGDAAFEIYLARSQRSLIVPANETILDVLIAHRVHVSWVCKQGWCGACEVGLLDGRADHRDEVLDERQREHRLQICVSRAMPGELLILDL